MASYPDFDELIQSSENQNTPLILLMGPPRSGKTSILRVLFGKLSPHDTSFLEPTTTPCGIVYPQQTATSQKEALLKCRIIDLPGSSTFHRQHHALITKLLSVAACVVFVIDASADSTWSDATSSLLSLLGTMESLDVQRHVAVLLHKIDGEAFNEVSPQYTELRRGLLDSLRSASIKLPVTFYVTSLFDVTIFESFSRIFQQIIPQTNLLGTLLDGFISACGIEKVFIVDTNSKLYIASDSTLPDVTLYQLLGDMLDLVFDIGFVYSPNQDYEEDDQQKIGQSQPATLQDAALAMNELNQFGAQSLIQPQDNPTKPQNSNTNNNNDNNNNNNNNNNHNNDRKEKDDFDSCNAEITLHNGVHLSLRQLNSHISLLFSLRPGEGLGGAGGNIGNGTPPTNSKGVVEYNITCLKQAISQLFNLNIHGIQPRPSLITTLTQSGINPADYGVHHYMGSYASQSAIANLKSSYYSNLIGASLPAKSYMVGGQSLIGPSSMALNSSRAVPASISNGFGAVPEHSGINTPGGSLPNQRGR